MKTFISVLILIASLFATTADVFAGYVRGYTTKKGTYVQGYNRTSPNKTKIDNYSTKGNYNPYTGKKGTRKY